MPRPWPRGGRRRAPAIPADSISADRVAKPPAIAETHAALVELRDDRGRYPQEQNMDDQLMRLQSHCPHRRHHGRTVPPPPPPPATAAAATAAALGIPNRTIPEALVLNLGIRHADIARRHQSNLPVPRDAPAALSLTRLTRSVAHGPRRSTLDTCIATAMCYVLCTTSIPAQSRKPFLLLLVYTTCNPNHHYPGM